MTDVDQRVVQMRFDDKEFDEKAKKTMKTLDQLNEKLSFDAVAKKSDAALNEVVDNVEKIADKAYTIVDRVIDKIKDNIANNIFTFLNDTLVGQVKSGWQKYADMTKAVGTLAAQGHGMDKITKTLDRLAFFSDETSYNFNKMLDNIGKFTAAGIQLEDAEHALEGIAGLAGLSGVNAERASAAMDQMAQAIGSYMKKQDWMSVQNAALDTMEFRQTALETAEALGTLKKTADGVWVTLRGKKAGELKVTAQNFVDTLTEGAWFTSDVMVETYKKYSSAVDKIYDLVQDSDGELLAADAINQLKADNRILLRQYMSQYNVTEDIADKELNTISAIRKATDEEIEQYMTLHKVSKQVAENTLNSDYNGMLKNWQKRTKKTLEETEAELEHWAGWTNSQGLKAFTNAQEARTFEDVINSVKESVSSNWRSIYESIFGDYAEAKALWSDMADGLVDLFAGRLYEISSMFKSWKDAKGRETLWQGLYAFGGGISMFIENMRNSWDLLISDGESGLNVLLRISDKIKEAGFKFYVFMRELSSSDFFTDITTALHNIKAFLDSIFGSLYAGVRDAVPTGRFLFSLLTEFASILKEVTSNFKLSDAALDGLRRTFKGLTILLLKSKKTFVTLLVKIILPILNVLFSVLGEVVEVVLTLTGAIGDIIEYFMPLDSETDSLVTILKFLGDVLIQIIKLVGRIVVFGLQKVVPLIGVIIGLVTQLINKVKDLFNGKSIKIGGSGMGSKLAQKFEGVKQAILEAWEPLESFASIIDRYKDGKGLINFLNMFSDITAGIGNRLLLTVDAVVGFLNVLSESKFGKALGYVIVALRWVIRAGLWLFNNLLVPALKEIITELGLTIESVKGIIDERGILGLLDLIQEVFRTGIFGALMNTINLINSIMGGNGIQKIFSKGAKALESIADYFNTAKLEKAADVMIKIVAALAMMYGLLAIITFLPIDRQEKMRDAMVDFAIALGVIVGGVFILSASAALAGGNLFALAAAFLAIAASIATAFWAIKKMAELIDEISVEKIDKSLTKLEQILDAYALIIIKTVWPLAAVTAFTGNEMAGVGMAMFGLAASIYIILKALQTIDNVDISQMDKLAEFVNGVYLVLAAATALMIFAARGQDVHGIGIAIASIGVSFAAVKMILPLCKDVIAEKDVFIEGQAALATFGLFVLAMSAAMYFVTSGVRGVISGLASILLFKGFLNIITGTLFPAVLSFIKKIAEVTSSLLSVEGQLYGADTTKWIIVFAVITAALIAIGAMLIREWRYILEIWSDVDPISMVAIAVTIIGSLLIMANRLFPAIENLIKVLSKYKQQDIANLAIIMFLAISPVLVMILGFMKIMDSFTEVYGKMKNGHFTSNILSFNRESNAAASMFTSIMMSVLGIYLSMMGMMYIAARMNLTQSQADNIIHIILSTVVLALGILLPLVIGFSAIVKNLKEFASGEGVNSIINKRKFLLSSSETNITAIMRSIAGVINTVVAMLPLFVVFLSALEAFKPGVIAKLMEPLEIMFGLMAALIAILMVGMGLIVKQVKNLGGLTNRQATSNVYGAISDTMKAISTLFGEIIVLMLVLGTIAIAADVILKSEMGEFNRTMILCAAMIGLLMYGLTKFIKSISETFSKNSLSTTNRQNGSVILNQGYLTPLVSLIVSMLGIIVIIAEVSTMLIPAMRDLGSIDFWKITAGFAGIILLIKVLTEGYSKASSEIASGSVGPKLEKFSSIMEIIKMLVGLVVPIFALAKGIQMVADSFTAVKDLSTDQIDAFKWVIVIFGLIVALGVIAAKGTAAVPQVLAGVAAIGGIAIAIGFAAYLIGLAAEKLALAYEKWWKVTLSQAKVASSLNSNELAKSIEANASDVNESERKVMDGLVDTAYSSVGAASPAKEMIKLGKYCDQGLALGLTKNSKTAFRAASDLANGTQGTFEDILGIASPSKVFYKDGRFIVAGVTEGLNSQKDSLSSTMGELGDTITSSFSKSLEDLKLDVDILGGKSLDQLADEFLGGLNGETILGKLFGLGESHTLTQDYLRNLRPDDPITMEDWFIAGDYNIVDAMGNTIRSRTVGQKIVDKLKKSGIGEAVVDWAEDLGIDMSNGATGESFLSNLENKLITGDDSVANKVKKWLVGDGNETGGVLGNIMTKIENGDWVGIGETIGHGLGTGLKKIFGPIWDNIIKGWKNITGNFEGSDFFTGNSKSGLLSFKTSEIKNFNEETDGLLAKTLDDTLGEDITDKVLSGKYGVDILGLGIYSEKVIEGLDVDFEKRSKQLFETIHDSIDTNMSYIDEATGKLKIFLKDNANEAIKALLEEWGIASPSKVMRYIYGQVAEGGVVGYEEKAPDIVGAISDANSEQYREVSLGLQAIDELAEGNSLVQPSIVPVLDTTGIKDGFTSFDGLFGVDNGRIEASLNYEGSISALASSNMAMAGAVEQLRKDLLTSLANGGLIRLDIHNTANIDGIFDSMVTLNREEYNRTGSLPLATPG